MRLAFKKTGCFKPELDHSAGFKKGKTDETVAFQGKYFILYLGATIYFVANILYYFFPNSWCLVVPFSEKYSVEWGKQTLMSSKKKLLV